MTDPTGIFVRIARPIPTEPGPRDATPDQEARP